MKDQEPDPRETGAMNPYSILLCQLTGGATGKPCQKTAMNIWRRTRTEEIDIEVKHRAAENGTTRKGLAAMREKVAKELFTTLDDAEKEEWKEKAKEEHASDLAQWKKGFVDEPSTEPADRQR
jgi:hypothetical protein